MGNREYYDMSSLLYNVSVFSPENKGGSCIFWKKWSNFCSHRHFFFTRKYFRDHPSVVLLYYFGRKYREEERFDLGAWKEVIISISTNIYVFQSLAFYLLILYKLRYFFLKYYDFYIISRFYLFFTFDARKLFRLFLKKFAFFVDEQG